MTTGTASATGPAPEPVPQVFAQAIDHALRTQRDANPPAGLAPGLVSSVAVELQGWVPPWLRLALTRAFGRAEALNLRYVFLDKLLPAYLFGLIAASKGWTLSGSLSRLISGEVDLQLGLWADYQALSMIFFLMIAVLYLTRRPPLRRVEGPLQGIVALMGTYIMLPVAMGGLTNENEVVLLCADLLMIVGTGGAALALTSLGRCFGIFPEARGLVTHGPYRFVRHPMYLFESVAFLGVVLPAFTPLNFALYLLFTGLQLSRMRFEERALAAAFPESYPDYFGRTARLIPGLY